MNTTNIIDKDELHNFFDDLNNSLKNGNFNKVKNDVESYFNNIRRLINFEDFQSLLKTTKFNKNQKEIISDYYENGKDISDILAFKIAGFSLENLDNENKTHEFIKLFEDQIFTKDFYKQINNNVNDFNVKNNILDSILFIRNSILPNARAEVAARYYVYILSGNLQNDLMTDESFRESIKDDRHSHELLLKISNCMEFWKIDHDQSNDMNITIKTQYPNYSHFGFNHGFIDGGIHNTVTKNTAPGFFDVVMKSPDRENTYIARVNNNRAESDIFNHLSRRLIEESAILAMNENNKSNIVLLDFCKGHSESLIKKFTGDNIDEESLAELKKIFDIILHKAVSEITGFDPIIIQLGDTKYDIEQEEFLDLSLRMTEFMKNGNLNFDNKFIMDILQKTTEWMTINLMKNTDFYTEENIEKCNKYLENIHEISINNSIIKSPLEKEIDHLEVKLNNLESSKINLELNLERERILRRLKYLEDNDILSFISKEDLQYFTRLRNIFVDNLDHLCFVLQGDSSDVEDARPFAELKYITNIRNSQYSLFEKILKIETMDRDVLCKSTANQVRLNDPLIKLLHKTKNSLNLFQSGCSIESATELRNNIYEINEFVNQRGNIYNYFYKRDQYTTKRAFYNTGDFFEKHCEFHKDLIFLDEYIKKMEPKIKILQSILNSEKLVLSKDLENVVNLKKRVLKKEKIDETEIPKHIKITRLKY